MSASSGGRKIWIAALIVLTLFALAFFFKFRSTVNPTATLSQASLGAVQSAFFSSGTLVYSEQARLSAELVAKVVKIEAAEGQTVAAGQVLLKLDDSSVRAEIAQAEAQLQRSKIEVSRLARELEGKRQEWERNSALVASGFLNRQVQDAAAVTLDSARFQLAAAEKSTLQEAALLSQRMKLLDKTVIRSPISGVVMSVPIKLGETAVASAQSLAGSDLIVIADPKSMVVEVAVAEFDIARVKIGQKAMISTRAAPNKAYSGRVSRIARIVSAEGGAKGGADSRSVRTIPVRINLDAIADTVGFIAGMSCDVSITEASQPDALLVPIAALRVDAENPMASMEAMVLGAKKTHYVWKVSGAKATRQSVTLGFSDENRQEIRSGLNVGDTVVSGPAALLARLREGDPIREGAPIASK